MVDIVNRNEYIHVGIQDQMAYSLTTSNFLIYNETGLFSIHLLITNFKKLVIYGS